MTPSNGCTMAVTKCPRRRVNVPGAGHHLLGGDDMANATCSVDDCDVVQYADGWCQVHWARWRKNGDPLRSNLPGQTRKPKRTTSPPKPRQRLTDQQRFWAKVDKNGPIAKNRPDLGRCWVWTAAKSSGYGSFSLSDKPRYRTQYAHRAAYLWLVGPIPAGLVLDHFACDNRACCNPSHVRPVTSAENALRGTTENPGRQLRTHCVNGHEWTKANTYRRRDTGTRQCRACHRARRVQANGAA